MSYYIGFRFGWVRAFGHLFSWHDGTIHRSLPGRTVWGCWKVWVR
jgi:hypothetical protein